MNDLRFDGSCTSSGPGLIDFPRPLNCRTPFGNGYPPVKVECASEPYIIPMASVSVLHARGWHFICYAKFSRAQKMVSSGEAEWVDPYTIRYKVAQKPREPKQPLQCGQADAYELAGIEKYPRFHAGGLTRNEHRPAPIRKFQGARVGH